MREHLVLSEEKTTMTIDQTQRPSLENLIESDNLGLVTLHPGGLEITRELAQLCRVGKDTSVLDVASGTGESACYLAEELGAQVVGVDISDYMVETARRKAAQRNLPVEFKQGDAHQLPFEDNNFDAAISECTTCILDKERAIREMVRVVRAGGYVGIHDLCWKPETPEHMKVRLAEIEGERPETLAGWKDLFEEAGLVEVKTLDKSSLIPTWTKSIRKRMGIDGQIKVTLRVFRTWGIRGLRDVLESERIFQSPHTGYGIIVGQKPLRR